MPSDPIAARRAQRRRDFRRRCAVLTTTGFLSVGVIAAVTLPRVFRQDVGGDWADREAITAHVKQWTDATPRIIGFEPITGRRGADTQDQIESMASGLDFTREEILEHQRKHDEAIRQGKAPPKLEPKNRKKSAAPQPDTRVSGAYLIEFDRPVRVLPGTSPDRRWVYLISPDGKVSMFFPLESDDWKAEVKRRLVN